MGEEGKKDECCSTTSSSCCGKKKCCVGILIGLLLFGTGFWLGKSGMCPGKICPMTQQMPQAQQAQP